MQSCRNLLTNLRFLSQDRFVNTLRRSKLPNRRDPTYADSLRSLHSAILGLCALIESFPYSVEPWMPPLTEGMIEPLPCVSEPLTRITVLANHATDPVPISTTIRKCASEFKKVRVYVTLTVDILYLPLLSLPCCRHIRSGP